MATGFPTFGGQSTGFQSFGSFGSPQQFNPNSVDSLLQLAQAQGGSIAAAANELVHPQTSILSTISDGFKNAFKTFVDVISTPREVVAGLLSPDYTVGEAIQKHLNVSDVLFGRPDENASTMQKVGSFVVRTAADILTDPLTYVTFGAGSGFLGLRALPKITVAGEAAAAQGVAEGSAVAVSKSGNEILKYLRNVQYQEQGLSVAKSLQSGGEVFDLARKELKALLESTIDAPLNQDFAKKALANMLQKYPQLTTTLLDKGGLKLFGKTVLSGQRIAAAIKAVPGVTAMDAFTTPFRTSLQALFDPSMVKVGNVWQRLPEEYTNLETAAKDLSAATRGKFTTDLVNIVRSNKLTVEEANLLSAAVEAGKMPADPRLANAYKQFFQFSEDQYKFLTDSGIQLSKLDNHVPHILLKEDVPNESFFGSMLPPKQKVEAAMERKVADTIAEGKAAGFNFDENIVTAHLKRSLDNVDSGVSKQFMRSVASTMGMAKSAAPQGWRAISVKGITKEGEKIMHMMNLDGEELVFHPAVASRIEKFVGSVINDAASADLLKAFDKVQSLWKASVTSIFPAFHGRNAISNVFLHFMDLGYHSFSPVNHSMATQIVALDRQANGLEKAAAGIGDAAMAAKDKLSELMDKHVFTDGAGYNWSFGELRQVIKNNGVAFTPNIVGQLDVALGRDEQLAALFPEYVKGAGKVSQISKKVLPTTQEFAPFAAGREVGRAVEEQARILDFVANLRNTGDVSFAAQRTKQFLFDYGSLTNFERTFMKRLIPFYTFTRKNLELQARSLLETPGRVAAEVTALNNLGTAMAGGQLSPEDQAALPDWIKSGIQILKKKKGNNVEIYGSLGTPIEQPFTAIQPNQLASSISPLIRVPLEQMTGYSFFQGKPLSEVTNAAAFRRAPQPIKDFIGYTKITGHRQDGTPFTQEVSLQPSNMNLILNLPPTSRVLSALKQVEAANVSDSSKILQQLVGVRPYAFDIQAEQAKREAEFRAKLEQLLTAAHVTATFSRTFIPKN